MTCSQARYPLPDQGIDALFRYFKTPLTVALRQTDGFEEHITGRTPAGRWGEPQELSGAVIFLASPASDFVSGTSIVVDGGILGR